MTVCLRLWEAVPNAELLDENILASWLAASAEYMSYPFVDAGFASTGNHMSGDDAPPRYLEAIDEVRALFSAPAEENFGQGYEQFIQRRNTRSSMATSGTHFDPNNPVHEFTKQVFTTFEEDVSSVYTYHSHMP